MSDHTTMPHGATLTTTPEGRVEYVRVQCPECERLRARLAEAERLMRKIHDELWEGDHKGMLAAFLADQPTGDRETANHE